jgi:hypothetical protein
MVTPSRGEPIEQFPHRSTIVVSCSRTAPTNRADHDGAAVDSGAGDVGVPGPYIFRDYDHVFKALDGSTTLTDYYSAVLDKKELKLVGFIAAGYRGIYGHYPINGIADIKGKKVGVQEDKILVATFKALGMISTPIAFPEVATALQTKVIDFSEGGVRSRPRASPSPSPTLRRSSRRPRASTTTSTPPQPAWTPRRWSTASRA